MARRAIKKGTVPDRLGAANVSLKISDKLLKDLKEIADEQQVDLGTLATQIFTQYVGWDKNAGKAGLVPTPKSVLTSLMDRLTDEEIKNIADRLAREYIRDATIMMQNDYSIQSFLKGVEAWIKVSGFPYRHEVVGDWFHTFFIQHDMGPKWSLYLAEVLQKELMKMAPKKLSFEPSPNSLRFSVDVE